MTLMGFGLHSNCTDVPFSKALSYNEAQQCCLFFPHFQVLIFSLLPSKQSLNYQGGEGKTHVFHQPRWSAALMLSAGSQQAR